jgi:hypothetical protein
VTPNAWRRATGTAASLNFFDVLGTIGIAEREQQPAERDAPSAPPGQGVVLAPTGHRRPSWTEGGTVIKRHRRGSRSGKVTRAQ